MVLGQDHLMADDRLGLGLTLNDLPRRCCRLLSYLFFHIHIIHPFECLLVGFPGTTRREGEPKKRVPVPQSQALEANPILAAPTSTGPPNTTRFPHPHPLSLSLSLSRLHCNRTATTSESSLPHHINSSINTTDNVDRVVWRSMKHKALTLTSSTDRQKLC